MKDGKLSNREKQALWSALKSLNAWIDWQEENDLTVDDEVYLTACAAAERLRDFLSWIDD